MSKILVAIFILCCTFATVENFPTAEDAGQKKLSCHDDPDMHFDDLSIPGRIDCVNAEIGANDIHRRNSKRKRRVALYTRPWPKSADGKVYIPYQFHYTVPLEMRLIINKAFLQFYGRSCIQFVDKKYSDRDYITIKSLSQGCYSYLGRVGGEQEVNLQHPGCNQTGVAIHELLHVLGFHHTMVRNDVEKHLIVNMTNVYNAYRRNFYQHSYGEMDIFGEGFCFNSVMMYGAKDFAIDRTKDVLTIRDPELAKKFTLGRRDMWSECDIRGLNRMYQCHNYL